MQLYPAIDIKGGQCVRLTQGMFDQVKVYSDTPADVAKLWVEKGASYLHLVDLDGALAGSSVNEAVIKASLERCPCRCRSEAESGVWRRWTIC